mgnify:CR=1 FL=1
MSLREDIAEITNAQRCPCGDVGYYVVPDNNGEPMQEQCEFCYTQNSYFNLDLAINKVLDAAVEAATERLIGVSEAQGAKRDKLSMIVAGNSMIDEINKLRGE